MYVFTLTPHSMFVSGYIYKSRNKCLSNNSYRELCVVTVESEKFSSHRGLAVRTEDVVGCEVDPRVTGVRRLRALRCAV